MSRTYKDSNRVKLKRYYKDRWETEHTKFTYETSYRGWAGYEVEDTGKTYTMTKYLQKAGVKPKKRKEVDTTDHWMSTPSWWTKLCMIKPERRNAHLIEKAALKTADIEDVDFPDLGRKPHIYYW